MARTCIFCGAEARTREHVFPSWLEPLLPGEGAFHVERQHEELGADPLLQTWGSNALDLTVRRVCGDCNNGWMSELEAECKPLLAPMIAGRAQSLSKEDQTKLATWMAKTVVVGEAATPAQARRVIPRRWHTTIHQERRPPKGSWVWLARYVGGELPAGETTRPIHWTFHPLSMQWSGGEKTGVSAVLSLGQLVFQLLGVFDRPEETHPDRQQPFLKLWPDPIHRAPWPSVVPTLTDGELLDLVNSFNRC